MTSEKLNAEYIRMLAEQGNGAIETHLPEKEPLLIVLAGPIKIWWGKLDSEEYKVYSQWRDAVRVAVTHAGHLVYSPHRAWQGAWHERAQFANDAAILHSDVLVILTPSDTESVGTVAEIDFATKNGKTVLFAPPSDDADLREFLAQLEVLRDAKK